MSILLLPTELLLLIAAQLECKDLNALVQAHSSFYRQLIGCLYRWNLESRGPSALIWAAKSGSINTLQRFLDIGVDLHWRSRYRALMSRARTVSVSELRRSTLMPDTQIDHPICHAATSGQAEFVRKLIEHGIDINFKDGNGRSPLALAARQGHFALVQMLVSLGANQLSYDWCFQRPAANAASQGHHLVADYLLQELANYAPIKLNHTIMVDIQWMLFYAAKEGNEKRIRFLLSKGADINCKPKGERCTPLGGALLSSPQPLKTVRFLLDRGADPNIVSVRRKRYSGWLPPPNPPLSLAMLREESLPLIKLLLKYGADARQCGVALFDAIRLEKSAEFRLLVDHHADLYVCLRRRSLIDCARGSDCQSIRDACLGLDPTLPTRELARRTAYRHPAGRRRGNEMVLTIRAAAQE